MFTLTRNSLVVFQILAHLSFFILLYYGTLAQWAIAVGLYLFFATIGGTVTYHRLLTHRSFKAPKWFEYFGTVVGSIGGGGSSLGWVAVHREHHKFTDVEKDPHSPWYKGFFRVQFMSMFEVPNIRYIPDLLRSKFHMWMHHYYWLVNLIYITLICLLDPFAIIYAYFVPTLFVWHAGSFTNTVNHSLGYQNFDTGDRSTNNLITGYLIAGEGWHNNHHARASDPQFGKKWWEFDLGWQVIKLVRKDS